LFSIIDNIKDKLWGLSFVALISFVSVILSEYIEIGSIPVAIIIGFIINNLFVLKSNFSPGINFSEKYLLNIAIILMGFSFNKDMISKLDSQFIIYIISFVLLAFIITFIISKIFKFSTELSILLGFGNAICGSSAIASVSPILSSKKEDILLSISSINIIGTISIFLLPLLLQYYSVTDSDNQGLIIGGTIQAVGQVSAAGSMISSEVSETAVIIKMCRILLLFPALIIASIIKQFFSKIPKKKYQYNFPFFIIGFIIVVLLNNYNLFHQDSVTIFKILSKYCLLFSMSALGLKVSFKEIAKNGLKIFSITFIAFIVQVFIVIQIVT